MALGWVPFLFAAGRVNGACPIVGKALPFLCCFTVQRHDFSPQICGANEHFRRINTPFLPPKSSQYMNLGAACQLVLHKNYSAERTARTV